MFKTSFCTSLPIVLFAVALGTGCANSADPEVSVASADVVGGRAGAVYTLSNDANANAVIVFRRAADGSLQRAADHATTGKGSGDGLGSQGALVLTEDRRWLLAVNAGSSELSVFAVDGESLYLSDTVPTGGVRPVSVTEHDGVVYVLHAGDGHNDVTGFTLRHGHLRAIAHSTRALSAPSTGPAQVSFSPSGRALIVTEKMTNLIDELRIDPVTHTPRSFVSHTSNGQTPFGFATTHSGLVVVSEAFGGADDASAVSSYQLAASSGLATVSASVPDRESAACWVVLAKNDRLAYTTNTKSGTVSAYNVHVDGSLDLVDEDGRSAELGDDTKPTDLALSRDDRFLYAVESGTGGLAVMRIASDGSLTVLPGVSGLPTTVTGLAAQ